MRLEERQSSLQTPNGNTTDSHPTMSSGLGQLNHLGRLGVGSY